MEGKQGKNLAGVRGPELIGMTSGRKSVELGLLSLIVHDLEDVLGGLVLGQILGDTRDVGECRRMATRGIGSEFVRGDLVEKPRRTPQGFHDLEQPKVWRRELALILGIDATRHGEVEMLGLFEDLEVAIGDRVEGAAEISIMLGRQRDTEELQLWDGLRELCH